MKTEEEKLALRSLFAGTVLAAFITCALLAIHQNAWAWGFAIGAALSLFSLFTLKIAVPFLMWPGAPPQMKFLLGMTLFMKMPIYCIGLYVATNVKGITPGACCIGICLVPTTITLKTIGLALADNVRHKETAKDKITVRRARAVHERG